MPYIPEDVVDEIAARANIVEVVTSYVPGLKQAGNRWKACCPFHHEKTPSFIVSPESGTFHCFGCGAGGNVFKFIMQIENLDFPNAAQMLARKYGVVIPERTAGPGGDGKSSYSLRERLFLLHDKLASWYEDQLRKNPDSPAAQYFKTREMTPEFAQQFRIGAAPDAWDAMIKWATDQKFTMQELMEAHLVSQSAKGTTFDFFRNRLIFPIWNEQGRVVGFSARQIQKDQGGGKYVNSMESPIFKKGRILYALNFARPNIPKKGYVILCEGQMDVIAMHTAGCDNAVAPQGTAFTEDQARMLQRYTSTVYLATDSDAAGMKAVLRDAEILLPMGFELKVVTFPGGKDPDELLHKNGPEAVREAVEKATDFFEYLYQVFSQEEEVTSPAGKIRLAVKIRKYLLLLESEIARDSYTEWLAGKLMLPADSLKHELRKKFLELEQKPKFVVPKPEQPQEELPDSEKDSLLKLAFSELLRVIIRNRVCAEKAVNGLEPEYLDKGTLAQAVGIVIQSCMNEEYDSAPALIAKALSHTEADASQVTAILAEEPPQSTENEADVKTVDDCLRTIRRNRLQKQIGELRSRISGLAAGEEKTELLKQFMLLSRKLAGNPENKV